VEEYLQKGMFVVDASQISITDTPCKREGKSAHTIATTTTIVTARHQK
jgi:hypothetical protein